MQVLKSRSLVALEALLIFCLVLVVFLPLTPAKRLMPSRDAGVFLYTGWRITQGELPYLHVWDHKPPVIYYLDALGLTLTPGSRWGVWCIEVVSLFLAALMLYALLKRFFGFWPAVLASILWTFTLMYMLTGGNITEEYPLAMQAAGLLLFFLAERDGKYAWRGGLIGALAALTLFTRQTSIGVFLAIGVYLLVARLWQRDFRKLLADLLPILAGGLAVIAVIVIYFQLNGALERFWDNAFAYNFIYTDERDSSDRFAALMKGMDLLASAALAPLSVFGWAASLMLLIFKRDHFEPPLRAFLAMLVIALPLEIVLVTLGGRPRTPYFITPLPVFAIFAGLTLKILFDWFQQNTLPKLAAPVAAILLILTLCAIVYDDYLDINNSGDDAQQDKALLNYIAHNTTPQDTLLMWNAESAYNFASQRRSPTRFVYQYDLYKIVDEKNTLEFLNDILTEKPKLIILTAADKEINDVHFAYRSGETGRLIDLIDAAYAQVPAPQLTDWVIYKLKGKP